MVVRLNTAIKKTIEKCNEFYKGIHLVHNHCMILIDSQIKFSQSGKNIWRICKRGCKKESKTYPGSKLLVKKTSIFGLYKHQVINSSCNNLWVKVHPGWRKLNLSCQSMRWQFVYWNLQSSRSSRSKHKLGMFSSRHQLGPISFVLFKIGVLFNILYLF